ncbi:MAG: anthranilate synthase component I [Phormidesmis sp.]
MKPSSTDAERSWGGEAVALRPCQQYLWRSHPLLERTGSDVFAALFQSQTGYSGPAGIAALLESPYRAPTELTGHQANEFPGAIARYSICAGAPRTVDGDVQLWTPEIGYILPLLRQMEQALSSASAVPAAVASASEHPDDDLPYVGGWLGWLGYDFAWEIERLPWSKEDRLPFPVAFWYEPAEFAVLDHHSQRLWLAAETSAGLVSMSERVTRPAAKRLLKVGVSNSGATRSWETQPLVLETGQTEFEQAVRRAKSHICAGDVFQVNHSLRFQAQTTAPSWEVYKTLHQINPSPFASYWHTPWGSVVSCSPERLVHLRSGVAQSRPIAGTRPRGKTRVEDRAIAQELQRDPKERAEHIMLVDLERNDLGRVCKWGSVQVAELMTVERYSHVMHLVSNVSGELQVEQSVANLVAAMFPGGTITGCPKVRCMAIIEALEPVRRSLFYGSCGYFDRRGRLDLNILIRTLLMTLPVDSRQTVWGQVGAGIVADSDPEREWRESLQKAKAQLSALGL